MPKVYLASDHAGFELKQALLQQLPLKGVDAIDCGAPSLDPDDDYPDYITPCAERVAEDVGSFGIVIGGSGQGEAMAANRVKGVRAAVYYGADGHTQRDADGTTLDIVTSVRMHNDANVLSLGARFLSVGEAEKVVDQFLAVPFSGEERHVRRINKF